MDRTNKQLRHTNWDKIDEMKHSHDNKRNSRNATQVTFDMAMKQYEMLHHKSKE